MISEADMVASQAQLNAETTVVAFQTLSQSKLHAKVQIAASHILLQVIPMPMSHVHVPNPDSFPGYSPPPGPVLSQQCKIMPACVLLKFSVYEFVFIPLLAPPLSCFRVFTDCVVIILI